MEFEWDENKRLLNLTKHGIDFADLWSVFEDLHSITLLDNRKDYGEIRQRTMGLIRNVLVVVVIHTQRNSKTRIISARRAKKKEREEYYVNR
jgi:uncharacterized DUF497 family protein